MKIIAIDQSSKSTGFSIGINGKLADYEKICATGDKDERVFYMVQNIRKRIEAEKPDLVVFENIQMQAGNVKTYQMLAWLQGMLIYVLRSLKIQFEIVPPITWKAAIGINAKLKRDGQKTETIKLMESKYNIDLEDSDDLADSLGILTYIMNKKEKK